MTKRFNIGDTVLTDSGWKGTVVRKLKRFTTSRKGKRYNKVLTYIVENNIMMGDYHNDMLLIVRKVLTEKTLGYHWKLEVGEFER